MTTWADELYIGDFSGGVDNMVKISSLGADETTHTPNISEGAFTVEPASFSQVVSLGDGSEREEGWLQTAWHINGLKASQYDALFDYREGHTTQVYIRTLANDGATYANYLTSMIWPVRPNRADPTAIEHGLVYDFELRFIQMVLQT